MQTRSDDETLLRWMALRTEGVESPKIADMFGVSAGYVRSVTNLVVRHDEKLHLDMIDYHNHPDSTPCAGVDPEFETK